MNPSLNNHKEHPPVNNNHKAKHPLVLYRNLFHLNSVMMMKCSQVHGPWPEKRLPQKIPDLYQRNQDIVYDRKQITFNPFLSYFLITDQKKNKLHIRNSCIVTKCQVRQNFFFLIYHLPVIYSLKCIFYLFQYQSDIQLLIFLFSSSHLLTPLTNCSCSSSVPVLVPVQ